MTMLELATKSRSYRRFDESARVTEQTLRELIELARLAPTAGNAQPLRFRPVTEPEMCARVFATLGWAAALPDWPGPAQGERPAAYVVVLCDLDCGSGKRPDAAIAAQTMLLGAVERGLGGCMLGNVRRPALAGALGIDLGRYSIDLVIALGVPDEEVRLTLPNGSGGTAYYRRDGVHWVPKRPLEELIV